jgi:hypothetical protein
MTPTMSFQFDDAALERMLEQRAGPGAPATLVPSIINTLTDLPQERRFGLRLPGWGRTRPTRTLALAAVLLLATVIAGVAVIGSRRNEELAPPIVSPSPAATVTGPGTPAPGSFSPSLAPDGQRLIVLALGTGSRVEIYTLDPFAGDRVDIGILQPQAPVGQSIQWASDRRTAITYRDSDSVHAIVNVDIQTISQLSVPPSGGRDAVSPDGDLVARLDYPETGGVVVVVVDLAGNEVIRTPLPEGSEPLIHLAWAPDASQIAVSTCLPCGAKNQPNPQHLLLVPLDGGVIRDRATGVREYLGDADWSPDMSTILVADDGGLLTVPVQEGDIARLTGQLDSGPAWSPDGSRIVFRRSGADAGVYVMDGDGANPVRLVSSPDQGSVFDIHWSPDGAWILYGQGRTETTLGDLWIVPSTGGEPRLIASNAVADW